MQSIRTKFVGSLPYGMRKRVELGRALRKSRKLSQEIDYLKDESRKILIAECTFVVDEHIERALAGAHMHVDEFVKMVKNLDNEHIIITHLSQRTHIGQAKKILKEKLGDELYPKVLMLMDRKHRQF